MQKQTKTEPYKRLTRRLGALLILLTLRVMYIIFHLLMLIYQILVSPIMAISSKFYKAQTLRFVRQMDGNFGVDKNPSSKTVK